MVDRSGLEPPTSRLSGACSNQLSYRSIYHAKVLAFSKAIIGGGNRDRTGDLLLARQALSQLSYTPIRIPCFRKCSDMISLKTLLVNKMNNIFCKNFTKIFQSSPFRRPFSYATLSCLPSDALTKKRRFLMDTL